METCRYLITKYFSFNVLVLLFLLTSPLAAQEGQKAIIAGSMIDVTEGKAIQNVVIVIEKNKIIKIVSFQEKDQFKELIDLSDYTVLPGLIDCHTHLTANWYLGAEDYDEYTLPAATYGILGSVNAKETLKAGFTTVRDLHSYFYSDVALRDAIQKKWIQGPRMYVSGPGLTITGGHAAWGNWLSPQLQLKENPGSIVDGADEVRKESRNHIKNRVDLIKVIATGGFGTYGSLPGAASFTIEELHAAVDEARKRGLKVAAHAHGNEGIKNALKAGVHSIEHGTYLDQESINLLKEKKAFLVMDLLSAWYELIELDNDYSDKALQGSNTEEYKKLEAAFYSAYSQGVNMAFGTDAGVYPHGRNAEQFTLMKKAGMKEMDIIQSATIKAAELIGIEKDAGSIEPGKWADIIAVKGDPLRDIALLEHIAFIMKDGQIFKNE